MLLGKGCARGQSSAKTNEFLAIQDRREKQLTNIPCFPENKTGSYINFCSKKGLIFKGCFIFFMYIPITFIQIQSCHHLLVAAQWWMVRFYLTGAYFGGRAHITSILKNHTRVISG